MVRVPWRECLAALSLGGCVLAWQPTDTPGAKAEKLAARIPLGIVSLGASELIIARETAREAEWQAEAAKAKRREELNQEAERWKEAAVAAVKAKDEPARQLALTFFEAARADLAALDAPQPPLRDAAAAAPRAQK
ncbi:MAG TPA: hypothetical protein VMR86_21890 [Myxococcota bacterium]|nr:hypothetical protein [Myxococcota bacterium]